MLRKFTPWTMRSLASIFILSVLSLPALAEDSLETISVSEAGVSQEGLDSLKALLEETNTRAAAVAYRGKIVAEWYWLDADKETTFEVWSTSKSYASTCIGLLVDEGKINTIDEPVGKYIPSWNDGEKAKVTIAHLLDQVSGLEEGRGFVMSKNQLETALNAPILTPPGDVGRYNNAACNVLSAIISAASGGDDPEVYMRRKVWDPIGMKTTSWRRDGAGNVITYAGIQSTARDLLRFGLLFYNEGTWKGNRILSSDWISEATHERTQLAIQGMQGTGAPYGLLWWLDFSSEPVPHNYSSLGLYGNNMTVIPELHLVGVRLVGNNRDGAALMMRSPEWVERLAGVVQLAESAVGAGSSN